MTTRPLLAAAALAVLGALPASAAPARPVICDALDDWPGVYGPVTIGPEGSVYVGGTLLLACS